MLEVYRSSFVDWKPSPVVALATSVDESQVAAAREDGSLEIWLVSPGAVGWNCQLTIHGDTNSRVSSLVWCQPNPAKFPSGRLLSSSIDGSVSEWDIFDLRQKTVLDSVDASIWQMAVQPNLNLPNHTRDQSLHLENGHVSNESEDDDGHESSESDDDDALSNLQEQQTTKDVLVALACDDGCVRLYSISDSDKLTYVKSLARVSGRVLSVTWSSDGRSIYAGSSDGFIRCWDAESARETYRITVGAGGLGSGPDLCIWSLLALRCGTLVSADSNGSVQFWDSQHGTLLQAHSYHKGDVNALVAAPGDNRVYSAGSDGQVILYKFANDTVGSSDEKSSAKIKRWVYVGYVRAHTHDVRALTMAVPISREDLLPEERYKRVRGRKKPIDFSYHKWAHLGVPMLISGGDDTKLFAYSAKEFNKFSPHDICPAPQRVPIQVVLDTVSGQMPLLLVQAPNSVSIFCVRTKSAAISGTGSIPSGGHASMHLVTRVTSKDKGSRKIICSTISTSGVFFAYSDHDKPCLFQLKRSEAKKAAWSVHKRQLPANLPFAHSMVFSFDSSRLIIAGHDRRIYVVDVGNAELVHTFTPHHREHDEELPPSDPPITKMFISCDGQWLAAINCFGDIYVFNLETQRQHWFISRLDGASVAAGGFNPRKSNVLIISTSSNQVYAFDVEAKQLGEWSMRNTFVLPRRYQEFPGEVIGLSFPPSASSSSVIIYSSRAMCLIDFGLPVDRDDDIDMAKGNDQKKQQNSPMMNGIRKRKHEGLDSDPKHNSKRNFEFCAFRDPVLFVGHLSKNSVLIVDKPWLQVVKTFDTQPVHRHIYGT